MKAFVSFVIVLILVAGGLVGYLFWERMNRIEPRGAGLVMNSPIPDEEIELAEKQYNEILDQESVLINALEQHDLVSYYGVSSKEEALKLFREDSYVSLPGGKNIHILFRGKRSSRDEREVAARTLAEDFVKAARIVGSQ